MKPGAADSINPLGPRPSKGARIGLHPWTGRTKEFKGIDPGRHGRLNCHGLSGDPIGKSYHF